MNGSAWRGVALAALLLPLLQAMPAASAPAGESALQWWGPTELGDGHHLRLGATVTNPTATALVNPTAALEVDLGQLLAGAGWPHVPAGDREQLRNFHLDPNSIRVVAMTDLAPPAPGTSHGLLRAVDNTWPSGDLRRFELPSLSFNGSFEGGVNFQASVNPVVTVVWRVGETIPPGATRSFMVYFDSDVTAAPKAIPDYDESFASGDILGTFWSGPGRALYGYSVPQGGREVRLQIIAIEPGTSVQVFIATSNQPFSVLGQPLLLSDAFSAGEIMIPGDAARLVKVVANRPVSAQITSSGFVPSIDAGMAGRDFVFAMMHPELWEQDTVYFRATNPRDADGILAETIVEVTPLAGGPALRFTMASGSNPWDYTIGPRAALQDGGPCSRPVANAASPSLPFGPGLYRARVLSGERVLLQYQAVDGLSQVPTLSGAPEGRNFSAALSWSDERYDCKINLRIGAWFGSPIGATANVSWTTPELPFQAYPRGAANPPAARYPPGRSVDGAATFNGPFYLNTRDTADRMLDAVASSPIRLFAGQFPAQVEASGSFPPILSDPSMSNTVAPVVNGPLGGSNGGRDFAGPGAAIVIAPFNGTRIAATMRYNSGVVQQQVLLSQDARLILADRPGNDPLLDYSITSNLPIVVHPTAVSSGTLAGVPRFLKAVATEASLRGFLLDLASPDGLDPITRSAGPGVPISYSLTLSNLARGADGLFLPDTASLTAAVPEGWTVSYDGAPLGSQPRSIALAPGQTRSLSLIVSSPVNVTEHTSGIVTVTATSQGNPKVSDTMQIVTFVKTVFGVGLWFEGVDGTKFEEAPLQDGVAQYNLVVQNQGGKRELVRIQSAFKWALPTWIAELNGTGSESLELDLDPAPAFAVIGLRLQRVDANAPTFATAVVTATIASSPAIKDAVQAAAYFDEPADVELRAERLSALVNPGEPAVFNLTLTNRGAGPAALSLESQLGAGSGWSPPNITAAGVVFTRYSLQPGEIWRPQLASTPNENASAGTMTSLRFALRNEKDGHTQQVVVQAKVRAVHNVIAFPPAVPIPVDARVPEATVDVRLTNAGNLDELLRPHPLVLPAGWNLTFPEELFIPRHATQTLPALVTVAKGYAPGFYPVAFALQAIDGHRMIVNFTVQLGAAAAPSAGNTTAIESEPGAVLVVDVPVTNQGNEAVRAKAVAQPGEPWAITSSPERVVGPGETTRLVVNWQVPPNAPDGLAVHTVRIEWTSESGVALPASQVHVNIDIGRADLAVANVLAVGGPSGSLVRAELVNHGVRPARDFAVHLRTGTTLLDSVQVGQLAPGARVNVSLAASDVSGASVRVDALAVVIESNEANNDLAVNRILAVDNHSVPGPSMLVLALALALAVRRRRP